MCLVDHESASGMRGGRRRPSQTRHRRPPTSARPTAVAEVALEITVVAAVLRITEEFLAPFHGTGDRTRVGIDEQLRRIETMSLRRPVQSAHAVAVKLPARSPGTKQCPRAPCAQSYGCAPIPPARRVRQTGRDRRARVLREDRKVDSICRGSRPAGVAFPAKLALVQMVSLSSASRF